MPTKLARLVPTIRTSRDFALFCAALVAVRLAFGIPASVHYGIADAAVAVGRADVAERQLELSERSSVGRWIRVARLYRALGRPADAQRIVRDRVVTPDSPVSPSQQRRAFLVLATLEHEQGELSAAEEWYTAAIESSVPLAEEEACLAADVLYGLGTLRRDQARLTQSEEAYRRALALRESGCASDAPEIARCLYGLGTVLRDRHALLGAELYFHRALALLEPQAEGSRFREWLLPPMPGHATEDLERLVRVELSGLYLDRREFELAEHQLDRAAALAAEQAPIERVPLLLKQAQLDIERSRLARAEAGLVEAMATVERDYPRHPIRAKVLLLLASVHSLQGREPEAAREREEALALLRMQLPAGHPVILWAESLRSSAGATRAQHTPRL